MTREYPSLTVDLDQGVAVVEMNRPPHNFLDVDLVRSLADALEALDREDDCRAVVLASAVKSFCAGANLAAMGEPGVLIQEGAGVIYQEAVRLFEAQKPIVGAVHGAAVGGGLGLALVPDLRVTCAEAYFSANFCRLGLHPGFGTTHTLPRLVGPARADWMFYTGRRVGGEEAVRIGLADVLAPRREVRRAAIDLAREIAASAPLAVVSTRATLRRGLAERVQEATDRELREQQWLSRTEDFKEGVRATAERRPPRFKRA
ncbi:MAG: enoyl-CoA hydratase/isomerase family protein [Proteobacteria bacterium]|nr:enoyl-CoA hydratase/isomerase family protein [Pseudomonadota bacterium]MBU1742767.1 enoyl-CoA hydratase/isomerase family protein [Pseudomonadota bacterium]